ncbi:trans-aconitate 2-methyltransferase [Micromonospora haikouensis]|uniref:Trans-aconitate 2-methyltransferase n=1 Tax=Micromonospora haikouensis TaxID=686309 RepID=A0A1C4W4B5_9ACTN|nr:methyltransferase domain-containing protein [Micromonospora haikouensis]SCE90998.1 trans-aconitate 2-methyltransferase [Micromonospora haikouensis]
MWDPATYLRYRDERGRPFHDLLARVPAERPRAVVDLGCGPGTLTASLAARWPHARVAGLDASAEMIDRAVALDAPVDFAVGDVRDWRPAPDVDVVVSNALLQWVPGHRELLTRWAAALAPALREDPVDDAVGYATLLTRAGCAVDAWESTYVHLLPAPADADHPVLTWMEGTALRPVRAALDDARWADFRAQLAARLAAAYPVRQGRVCFPFRRVFVVARTGARPPHPPEESP